MPWCPTCKNEYREGTVACTDCGGELVESLKKPDEWELLYIAESRSVADKFALCLTHSNISEYELRDNEFGETEVYLPSKKITDARKLLIGFQGALHDETSENIPTLDTEFDVIAGKQNSMFIQELQKRNNSVYVKAIDKYNDLKFSAISFISFGIGGVVFIILNLIKAMNFLNLISSTIMGIVFVVFFIIGLYTMKKANAIKSKIGEEESKTEDVKLWMRDHFTNSYYDQLKDPSVSSERHYFRVMEKLMQQITEVFPDIDSDYLEQLVDENYNVYLEHNGE